MRAYTDSEICLTIPARREDVLVIRTALGGAGLLMGLGIDRLDDLRTAADEACDFLLNQRSEAERLQMVCRLDSDVMETVFTALWSGEDRASAEADQDMAQAILETLIPQVTFETDDRGVKCIRLGLPVKES